MGDEELLVGGEARRRTFRREGEGLGLEVVKAAEGVVEDIDEAGVVAGVEVATFEAGGDDAVEVAGQGEARATHLPGGTSTAMPGVMRGGGDGLLASSRPRGTGRPGWGRGRTQRRRGDAGTGREGPVRRLGRRCRSVSGGRNRRGLAQAFIEQPGAALVEVEGEEGGLGAGAGRLSMRSSAVAAGRRARRRSAGAAEARSGMASNGVWMAKARSSMGQGVGGPAVVAGDIGHGVERTSSLRAADLLGGEGLGSRGGRERDRPVKERGQAAEVGLVVADRRV